MDYELEFMYYQVLNDLANLKIRYESVENSNKILKQQIETLAIENSNLLESSMNIKRKTFYDKWAFYHKNKKAIKEKYNLTDWRIVKKKSDALFSDNKKVYD